MKKIIISVLCLFTLCGCSNIASSFGFSKPKGERWQETGEVSKEFMASVGKDVDLTDKENIRNYANGNSYYTGYFEGFYEDFKGVYGQDYISLNKNVLDELLGLTEDDAKDAIGLISKDEDSFNSIFVFKRGNTQILEDVVRIVSNGYGADYPNTTRAYYKHDSENVSYVIFGDTDFMQVWSERLDSEDLAR